MAEAQKPGAPKLKTLSTEERKRAAAWIETHTQGRCPMCGSRNWQLANEFVEIRPIYDDAVLLGGHVYPQILLTCGNCAYTILFNAILSGVLEQPKPEAPKNAS